VCGRYAASRRPDDLVEEFEIDRSIDPTQAELPFEPDYNVAPTKDVLAVVERSPRSEPEAAPVRQLRVVRWGLVPSWAHDPAIGSRLINARVETAESRPAHRRALLHRRCLLPADGYFEWYDAGSIMKGRKQPFFIRPAGGGGLALAGLYEFWRDPNRDADDPRAWLWTATIMTTVAEPGLARLHDRMPLIVPRERYGAWLDPQLCDPQAVRELLVPSAPGALEAYPVSTAVGDVRANGPQLIVPIAPVDLSAEPAVAEEAADATLF
jgi:putative SOS response-associated peptidase YedK